MRKITQALSAVCLSFPAEGPEFFRNGHDQHNLIIRAVNLQFIMIFKRHRHIRTFTTSTKESVQCVDEIIDGCQHVRVKCCRMARIRQ